MKGNKDLIEALNQILTAELTGINQYFVHSKMLSNWGYVRLAAHAHTESIGEMKHADELIERILYLEGIPNLQRLGKVQVGETVVEQFNVDLALEVDAIALLNTTITEAVAAGDNGTRDLLDRILLSEEQHIDWIETQLELVKQIGEQAYLAQHSKE